MSTDATQAALETEVVRVGDPPPGGESVLLACVWSSRLVSVVSKNAGAVIEAYLAEQRSQRLCGRCLRARFSRPLLHSAERRLLLEAWGSEHCIFIADAGRDVEAGKAACVPTIGYANKQGKRQLAAASGMVIVDSME
ncbi:hypothetical protein [Kitasatospora sp. SC0581]|uniref:hypothetical protein n=1 Tax=Kitasatospora sp. SC0581 TaxID=3394360 RepID=UPI003A8AD635